MEIDMHVCPRMCGVIANSLVPTVSPRLSLGLVKSHRFNPVVVFWQVEYGHAVGDDFHRRSRTLSEPDVEFQPTASYKLKWLLRLAVGCEELLSWKHLTTANCPNGAI
jgi:hypothetical protein